MQTITVRPNAVPRLLTLPISGAAGIGPTYHLPQTAPLRALRPLLIQHQVQVGTI